METFATQNQFAIIVAGGTGSRMESPEPKQFLTLGKIPVLVHSIRAFTDYLPDMPLFIAVHPDYRQKCQDIIHQFAPGSNIALVEGGHHRFGSVSNALKAMPNIGWVAIHDAARPAINGPFVAQLFAHAREHGSAVPVIPMADSLRKVSGHHSYPLQRNEVVRVQTPQVFSLETLQAAYGQTYTSAFTDDATVMQAYGQNVSLCAGLANNIKITLPDDMAWMEHWVSQPI